MNDPAKTARTNTRQTKQTHLANCTVNATENDRFRHHPGHDALEAGGCFYVIEGSEIFSPADDDRD